MLEDREPLKDVAVIVVDESKSQTLGSRRDRTEAALEHLVNTLETDELLELRIVRAGGSVIGDAAAAESGTRLFGALARALIDIPRQRLAGGSFDHRWTDT